jgi:FlgD Ig-like domain
VTKLPVAAFAVLVAATVAAFFITQHLKVSTPLVGGYPAPVPAVINPVDGTTCGGVNHRRMKISFYLLNRSDNVDVYVVNQAGIVVRTLADGVYMPGAPHPVRKYFTWNGREDDGSVAPDGAYYVRVLLIHQGRTVTISSTSGPEPVKIKTNIPTPRVTAVTPQFIAQGAKARVTIRYTGNQHRGGTILIYRTSAPGWAHQPPVKSFLTPWRGHTAIWDGLIHERPAPAGTYLIGLEVTDAACNTGRFPARLPPPPGTASQADLTVG